MGCKVVYGSVLLLVEDEVVPDVDVMGEVVLDEVVLDEVVLDVVALLVVVVLQEQVTAVELKLLGGAGPTPTQ
jgi:hypothetical protein